MQKETSAENGKLGGRPQSSNTVRFQIPNIELVILTSTQYKTLLKKYGEEVLKKAIFLLENWLKTSPEAIKYRGKNNYGHFRSDGWVINRAKN